MIVTAELRYADAKEIAAEARRVLKSTFFGIRFSVRSADNTVAVVYTSATVPEAVVWLAVLHLRAYEKPDAWGALVKHPILLASGETVRGLHTLTVRNDHRSN